MVIPGIVASNFKSFTDYKTAKSEIGDYSKKLATQNLEGIMIIVIADDASFLEQNLNNFLWTTFTRSNPAKDIYGVDSFTEDKHWGCKGPLIIDARKKPHHAPALIKDIEVEKRVDEILNTLD